MEGVRSQIRTRPWWLRSRESQVGARFGENDLGVGGGAWEPSSTQGEKSVR